MKEKCLGRTRAFPKSKERAFPFLEDLLYDTALLQTMFIQ